MTDLYHAWKELYADWELICIDSDRFRNKQSNVEREWNIRRLAGIPHPAPAEPLRLALIDTRLVVPVRNGWVYVPGDVLVGVIGKGEATLDICFPNGQTHKLYLHGEPSLIFTHNCAPIISQCTMLRCIYNAEKDASHEFLSGILWENARKELICNYVSNKSGPQFAPEPMCAKVLWPSWKPTDAKAYCLLDFWEWMVERKRAQQNVFLKELMETSCHPARLDNI